MDKSIRRSSAALTPRWSFAIVLTCIAGQTIGQGQGTKQKRPEAVQSYYASAIDHTYEIPPQPAKQVCVLVIGDTRAPNAIELNIRKDVEDFSAVLKQAFAEELLEDRLKIQEPITGRAVTKQRILARIRSLEVGPSDAIVVYYSGHGGWDRAMANQIRVGSPTRAKSGDFLAPSNDDTERFVSLDQDAGHFLALSSGDILYRWEIKQAIEARKCQLKVLITDCCANFGSVGTAKSSKAVRPASSSANENAKQDPPLRQPKFTIKKKLASTLFLNTVGWVSIQACPLGDVTDGDIRAGGVFTSKLVKRLTGERAENEAEPDDFTSRWLDLASFYTRDATPIDPSIGPDEDLDKSTKRIEDAIKNYDGGRSTVAFSFGNTIKEVTSRMQQQKDSEAAQIFARDIQAVKRVVFQQEVKAVMGTRTFIQIQHGRIVQDSSDFDVQAPWFELGWSRSGLPDEKTPIKIAGKAEFTLATDGKVGWRRFKDIEKTRIVYFNLTAIDPGSARMIEDKRIPNFTCLILVPGAEAPTIHDLERSCGQLITFSE